MPFVQEVPKSIPRSRGAFVSLHKGGNNSGRIRISRDVCDKAGLTVGGLVHLHSGTGEHFGCYMIVARDEPDLSTFTLSGRDKDPAGYVTSVRLPQPTNGGVMCEYIVHQPGTLIVRLPKDAPINYPDNG